MMSSEAEAVRQAAGELLRRSSRVLIVSHIRPDGDAVGSLLGLGLSLQAAGKTVSMVLQDGVPGSLRHLPGSKLVKRQPKGEPFDLRVVVDCSDLARTGGIFTPENPPELNIDHHITNLNFSRVNLVDPDAVATAAVLAENLPGWGFDIQEPAAQSLLTGIVSDTLGFRTSNTTPAALRLAADLMDKGANLADLYNRVLVRRSFESARFWGIGLDQLQKTDNLVWTSLKLADRIKVNYPGNDDADLVNFLATIEEGDVAVIFVEQKEGTVKVSWRAHPGLDVSRIALQFGGGGHPGASGAVVSGSLEEVQDQVLRTTMHYLENTTGNNGSSPSA